MVVDDSVVIRRLVCHALEQDPDLEIVAVAGNGSIALSRIPQVNPDVITLDIEMPEMDGLEFLRRMRPLYPGIRVVMFSTLTERGAVATLEALARGADDYVTKASNAGSLDVSLVNLKQQLLPKIHQFFSKKTEPEKRSGASAAANPQPAPAAQAGMARPEILLVGISTGGPSALAQVIPQLPADFPLPVLIVQHMPPLFTRLLAERLDARTKLVVREAAEGDCVEPGRVYIAPGDYHMKVARGRAGVQILLDQTPPLNSCRPAADALFMSAAEVYGGKALAAVLTGMGEDGLRGAKLLREQGAGVIVQDEASSVVWGMPGAIARAGLADEIVPLENMAEALRRRTAL
jgi:two-component system chemotaxis response regulator CheB